MIVAYHFAYHGKFNFIMMPMSNTIWIQLLQSGGKIGVNIFVMISGYFLISSKKIQTKKVLKLLIQIMFYSLLIFTIFVALGIEQFSIKDLVKHILGYPIWWFAKSYLALYLIHPYINKLLNLLEKKEYQKLILFFTLLWSILPTITSIPLDNGSLIWFVYIYLIGGYLKKYPLKLEWSSKKYLLIFLVLYFLTFISVIFFDFMGIKISFLREHATYLFNLEKISTLLISIFLFLSFSSLKVKYKKWINIISASTFGIYLIHDNEYMRNFLWQTIFKQAEYSNTLMIIPYSIIVIAIVFIVCSIIELLRIYILEKRYMSLIEKLSKIIDKLINKICNLKILDKI